MPKTFVSLIAHKRLLDKRLRSQFFLILVVASLVTVSLTFVYSMSSGIANKYALLGNGHLAVDGKVPVMEGIQAQEVLYCTALMYGQVETQTVAVKGIKEGYFTEERLKEITLKKEELASSFPSVMISQSLAKKLDLRLGDKTMLLIIHEGTFKPVLCVVGSLYDSGYKELDDSLVFFPYDQLRRFDFPMRTELILEGKDIEKVKTQLKEQGYNVSAWYDQNRDMYDNLMTSQNAVVGVFLVVALLCAFFVSEFASSLINDHRKEISTLKLLGAPDEKIIKGYLLSIVLVTMSAVVFGTALGLLLTKLFHPVLLFLQKQDIGALSYYLLTFDLVVPFRPLSLVLLFLFALSVLSTLISLRSVKKIPVLQQAQF